MEHNSTILNREGAYPSILNRHRSNDWNRMPASVEVVSCARLHFGMFSFGSAAMRSYGGVGLSINQPGIHLSAFRNEPGENRRTEGDIQACGPMAARAISCATHAMQAWNLIQENGCRIVIHSAPRDHVGLGSGTQLAMSIALAIRQLFRVVLPGDGLEVFKQGGVSEPLGAALASAVQRMGRSNIGLQAFCGGGLLVEAGRFVPSVPSENNTQSDRWRNPLLRRVHLPQQWRAVLVVLRNAVGLSGDQERMAFSGLPHVSRSVTAELARIAFLELLPAAIEHDFELFSEAVGHYGALAGEAFSSVSASLPYATALARIQGVLVDNECQAVGQSSWGPAVFALCPSDDSAQSLVRRVRELQDFRDSDLLIAELNSQGAVTGDHFTEESL